jgi:hypothetical protein
MLILLRLLKLAYIVLSRGLLSYMLYRVAIFTRYYLLLLQ